MNAFKRGADRGYAPGGPDGSWHATHSFVAAGKTRLMRPFSTAITVVLLAFAVAQVWAVWQGALARGEAGWDAHLYGAFGRRFLETGQAYFPAQFAGPYPGEGFVNLYPPIAMLLFAPFAFLPIALWWVIPLGILGWHLWDCRPAWWTWPLMALAACTLSAASALVYGNSVIWSVAFVCIGLRYPAAGALLGIKPSDLVMAIVFVRRRAFWIGLALIVAVSIPFGSLWMDWLTALGNLSGTSPLRNVHALPILAVPLLAWLGHR